jgi:hypothetical protein
LSLFSGDAMRCDVMRCDAMPCDAMPYHIATDSGWVK